MRAARDSSSAAVRAVCATLATGADGEIGMRKPPGGGPGGLENAPHEWPPWGHKRQLRGGCLVPRYAAGYFLAWSVATTNRHAPQMMSAAAWSFRGVCLHDAKLRRLHLPTIRDHTFGDALVSSSIRTSASARQPPAPRLHLSGRCSRVHLFKFENLEDCSSKRAFSSKHLVEVDAVDTRLPRPGRLTTRFVYVFA